MPPEQRDPKYLWDMLDEYGEIKHDRIWRVVTIHIPDLIKALDPLVLKSP